MKKGRFTEHQIVTALKKQEAGIPVKDISPETARYIVATVHSFNYFQFLIKLASCIIL